MTTTDQSSISSDAGGGAPTLHRPPRVPFDVRAQPALRRALGMWHVGVMGMNSLDDSVVEAIRLRAARYHDCHT